MGEFLDAQTGHLIFSEVHSENGQCYQSGVAPRLEAALSRGTMKRRLEAVIGRELEVQEVVVLSFGSGRRIVLLYSIRDCHGDRRVFGKLYSESIRAQRCHEILTALSGESTSRELGFRVPVPMGCLEDLNLVLYEPLEGRLLNELISTGAPAPLYRTGSCLAQLHLCHPPLDRYLDVGHEVDNLRLWSEEVAETHPSEGRDAPALAEVLARWAPNLELHMNVPMHKDFHAHHVIVGSSLGIIDLDEMRWGDPSGDIAHFCTYLRLTNMRAGISRSAADKLERAFLDGYAAVTESSWSESVAFFGVCACLKIARQLHSVTGVAPVPTGRDRDRQLAAILEYGRELAGWTP